MRYLLIAVLCLVVMALGCGEKPVEKPAETPAETPAVTPAVTPATEPAKTGRLEADAMPPMLRTEQTLQNRKLEPDDPVICSCSRSSTDETEAAMPLKFGRDGRHSS